MNITINILELASELANMELSKMPYPAIKMEKKDGVFVYTEEAQDIFNDLYDNYYSIIENTSI